MKKSDFFSDITNLSKALPAPQIDCVSNTPETMNHSNFNLFYFLAKNTNRISRDISNYIFDQFLQLNTAGFVEKNKIFLKQKFLSVDAQNSSPIFLAIANDDLSLAHKMLSLSCGLDKVRIEKSLPYHGEEFKSDDGLSHLFLEHSTGFINELESELQERLQGNFRGKDISGTLMHLLSIHLDRVEMLWEYLRKHCDIVTLSRMIYEPSGQAVDCFQRAKAILLHLHIPFSQLHHKNIDHKESKKNSVEGKTEDDSLESRYKQLTPEKIKKLVSWKLALNLKDIVKKWVMLRVGQHHDQSKGSDSLRDIYSAKLKASLHKLSPHNKLFNKSEINEVITDIDSSVLLFHDLETSLVTYGFSSVNHSIIREDAELDDRRTVWNSPFPPLVLAETRHLRDHKYDSGKSATQMAQLLTTYKNKAKSIQQAIQCAYTILEFARTLSTCRILVALTQEVPTFTKSRSHKEVSASKNTDSIFPSSKLPTLRCKASEGIGASDLVHEMSERHPLDAIRHEIIAAREQHYSTKAYLCSLLDESKANESNGVESGTALIRSSDKVITEKFLSLGAKTSLHITEKLNEANIRDFFSLKSEVSPMFSSLRRLIVEAMSVIIELNGAHKNLKKLMGRFLASNANYDEKSLLFGSDKCDPVPLSQAECDKLADEVLANIKSLTIKSITVVKHQFESNKLPTIPTIVSTAPAVLFEDLIRLILSNSCIFCRKPTIPICRGGRGKVRIEDYCPLSECPSSMEQKELLSLVEHSSKSRNSENNINVSNSANQEKVISSSFDARKTLKVYLDALEHGYRVSECVIELVLTVIGLHSMTRVYMLDPFNTIGSMRCSPYISLCYIPFDDDSVSARVRKENDIVKCFDLLQSCGIDLSAKSHEQLSFVMCNSDSPSTSELCCCSELQYSISCAAIFGKVKLLERLLDVENNQDQADTMLFKKNSCLLWHVLLVSPPPCNSYADYDMNGSYQAYEKIATQLLKNGYGTLGPKEAMLSVLDLASLKQYPDVVKLLLKVYKDTGSWETCSLSHIGAFHFICLSKKFDASSLQMFLTMQQFEKEHTMVTGVDLDYFTSASMNDSKISMEIIHTVVNHMNVYKNIASDVTSVKSISGANKGKIKTMNDILMHDNISGKWTSDKLICLLANSLKGIFYAFDGGQCYESVNRTAKCPLITLVDELTTEVNNLVESNLEVEVKTCLRTVCWSNLHFALCSRMFSKFELVFTYLFYADNADSINTNATLSSSGLSTLLPLIGMADTELGQVPADILHYTCFYGMSDSLTMMITSLSNSVTTFINLHERNFFFPLNNSVTPLEVAIAVGSTGCASVLLKHAKENLPFHEINDIIWKLLYSSMGKGHGGEELATLLFRFITAVYDVHSNLRDLKQNVNSAISHDLPRSGVVANESLIHVAARRGYAELCALLLKAGADPSAICAISGKSVLETSIIFGHSNVTQCLASWCPLENSAASKVARVFRTGLLKRRTIIKENKSN